MNAMDALAEHRQRNVGRLAARFLVRFHMALIFVATAGAVVLASRLLFGAGVDQLELRWALAVVLAYALFFALVRLWIFYVTRAGASEAGRGLPDVRPRGGDGGQGTVVQPGRRVGGGGPSVHWDDDVRVVRSLAELGGSKGSGGPNGRSSPSRDVDDGVVLLIALLTLATVLGGVALHLVWQAPIILPEAAFEALLAAGLVHAARRDEARGWTLGVLRATCVPFLVVLLVSAITGWAVQQACPMATRLADLVTRCD
jgi:hypothetical protein